jgi:signal recognition particle subunit SRP19
MVSRGEEKYVIYTAYFDKSASGKEGRKVSKKHAVEKPSLESIVKSAKSFGLHPIIEKDHAYPSKHWNKEGRILIDKKGSKRSLLMKISERL